MTQPSGSPWHSRHEYPTTRITAPGELSGKKAATIHPSMTGCQSPKVRQPKILESTTLIKLTNLHPRTRTKPPPQRRLLTSLLPLKKPIYRDFATKHTICAPRCLTKVCCVWIVRIRSPNGTVHDGPTDPQIWKNKIGLGKANSQNGRLGSCFDVGWARAHFAPSVTQEPSVSRSQGPRVRRFQGPRVPLSEGCRVPISLRTEAGNVNFAFFGGLFGGVCATSCKD